MKSIYINVFYLKVVWLLTLLSFSFQGLAQNIENVMPFNINTQIIPPYTTKEGTGFEDRLANELYRRLGFASIIKHVPAERGLVNLNQGLDDGILSRVAGLGNIYKNILQVDEVAVEWRFVAFTNNKEVHIESWQDFANYDVALVTGWKIFENNIIKYRSMIRVQKPEQLFRLLDAKRVDVVVYALRPGMWLINNLGIKNVRAIKPDLAIKEKYFYVHKRHKALVPEISRVLRNIKEDGTYAKLYAESVMDKGFE